MRRSFTRLNHKVTAVLLATAATLGAASGARASDHIDSPATVADPQTDIGDIYAWTASDGRKLNLAMTIVGHSFSSRLRYEFHVDSGAGFGRTSATTLITCRFPEPKVVRCNVGSADVAEGDAGDPSGLVSHGGHFKVFAGLRDDPFYNNVKGSLAAYGVVAAAVKAGAPVDKAGCVSLDPPTVEAVRDQFQHTDGGPPQNLLANWTASAIVLSLDLNLVNKGGPLLAIWGSTASPVRQLDRMARPFVGNTLLGDAPFSGDAPSGALRQAYNAGTPANSAGDAAEMERSLALHDALDGVCGNQVLADHAPDPAHRYQPLAQVFADDRLWVNSAAHVCTQFFAVELAALAGREAYRSDCGGRSPVYATPNTWRSLLVMGRVEGFSDGLQRDEHAPSADTFPFLAPPDPQGVNH